jgi:hypothetical protein
MSVRDSREQTFSGLPVTIPFGGSKYLAHVFRDGDADQSRLRLGAMPTAT